MNTLMVRDLPVAERLDRLSMPEPNSGCWLWTGTQSKSHYGLYHTMERGVRRVQYAHRVAYAAWCGPIPKGMFICHRCDNPPCINPEHLFLGTQQDNMDDMHRKGRAVPLVHKRGMAHHDAKFSDETIAFVRSSSLPSSQIGALVGMSASYVRMVRSGHRRLPSEQSS